MGCIPKNTFLFPCRKLAWRLSLSGFPWQKSGCQKWWSWFVTEWLRTVGDPKSSHPHQEALTRRIIDFLITSIIASQSVGESGPESWWSTARWLWGAGAETCSGMWLKLKQNFTKLLRSALHSGRAGGLKAFLLLDVHHPAETWAGLGGLIPFFFDLWTLNTHICCGSGQQQARRCRCVPAA